MLIYIITFACAIFFWKLAIDNSKDKICKLYIVLSIAFPIMLAALRNEKIGTDVLWYLKGCYMLALRTTSFFDYLSLRPDIEPLFLLLVFLLSKVFKNFFILQGAIQLLISAPIYYALWKHKDDTNTVAALIVYFFVFYMNNLNIMRQSIAISFSLLAVVMMEKKRYSAMIIIQIIAIGFHYSAVINMIILLIFFLKKSRIRKMATGPLYISLALIVILFHPIVMFASQHFILFRERYLLMKYLYGNKNLGLAEIILYTVNFGIVLFIYKKEDWYEFIHIMSWLSLVGMYLEYNMGIASRTVMYWNYYLIYSFPQSILLIKKDGYSRIIFYGIFVISFFLYWWYNFVFLGYTETVPYILGI